MRSDNLRRPLRVYAHAMRRDQGDKERLRLLVEGLRVGRDGGSPVARDYPGERPWPFTRGTIRTVAIDVSGEPYVDLERETAAMLARE